jgi:hypothetical protein
MSVVSRKERSVEQSRTQLRFRPIAVTSSDSFVLALLCSTSNEYYFALWDQQSHQMSAKELDIKTATVMK